MIGYIVWRRNGWTGPEWELVSIHLTKMNAENYLDYMKTVHYLSDKGWELKITQERIKE